MLKSPLTSVLNADDWGIIQELPFSRTENLANIIGIPMGEADITLGFSI